jgi:hypothetical protein
MADQPNYLERFQERKPVMQEWWDRAVERARQERGEIPAWDFEGYEPAIRGAEAHKNPSWYAPALTFGLGVGDSFPPFRAMLDANVYGSSDPEMQRLSHELMWARMNNPRSYDAGLNVGLAPGVAAPGFGLPWAGYVLATDPSTQKALRESREPQMAPGSAFDAGWGLRHRGQR